MHASPASVFRRGLVRRDKNAGLQMAQLDVTVTFRYSQVRLSWSIMNITCQNIYLPSLHHSTRRLTNKVVGCAPIAGDGRLYASDSAKLFVNGNVLRLSVNDISLHQWTYCSAGATVTAGENETLPSRHKQTARLVSSVSSRRGGRRRHEQV